VVVRTRQQPGPECAELQTSVAIGKKWAIDWIIAHPHQTFGLGGYSQGAQCAGELYLELLPGGQLEHRFGDLVGGFSLGDPMRPAGVTGGGAPDPGGALGSALNASSIPIHAGGTRPTAPPMAPAVSTCIRARR
jgi:hypothetical protein